MRNHALTGEAELHMPSTPEARDRARNLRLKRQYGLEEGEYETLLDGQGGGCAMCGRQPLRLRLNIDHDHKTGVTRGLLCSRCNRLLGWALDNAAVMEAGAKYLRDYPASRILGREVQGRTGRVTKRRRRKKTK